MTVRRAAALTAAALLYAIAAGAQPGACDRGCLEGFLDAYVEAVVAHDAARLPLAAIAEVFKIERGLIGPVESVLHQAPYGTGSGWSTWEESLSSEPRG